MGRHSKTCMAVCAFIFMGTAVSSCGPSEQARIHSLIVRHAQQHSESADKVQLGDSMRKVLSVLPEQKTLGYFGKSAESFTVGDRAIDIFYFRSGWEPDGRKTDSEFTPYLFVDHRLEAVGWSAVRFFLRKGMKAR